MQGTPGEPKARTGRVLVALDDGPGSSLPTNGLQAEKPPSREGRLRPPKWTPSEIATLRRIWGRIPRSSYGEHISRRTYSAMQSMARDLRLCLSSPRSQKKWTSEEDQTLRDVWGRGFTRLGYQKALPDRSYDAVAFRANVLGLNVRSTKASARWTPDEDAALRKLWGQIPHDQFEKEIPGRTINAVLGRAKVLGLPRRPKSLGALNAESPKRKRIASDVRAQSWSSEEIDRFYRLAADPAAWPAAFPERTRRSLNNMARRLNVRPLRDPDAYTAEELRLIRMMVRNRLKLRETRSLTSIANKLAALTKAELKQDCVIAAVTNAIPAHLPAHVREDAKQRLLLALLSGEIEQKDLPTEAKKAITATYGPQMYSLDTPLSDGSSMTWLDTIDDDHARF